MSDINFFRAIARISAEFKECGLEVPDVVLLKTHTQGMRLLGQLRRETMVSSTELHGTAIEHPDGSAWMQVEVYGIKIRWPAMKMALEKGGYVWT